MMSTTVKKQGETQYLNFAKGADSVIESKLSQIEHAESKLIQELDEYAQQGLRTLMYAMRVLDGDHSPLSGQSIEPTGLQTARESEEPQQIEQEYTLLGISGVEDLLQDNVKSCIEDFKAANMKVWMLTGDKGATAENIGRSCGIIDSSMSLLKIKDSDTGMQQ